MDLFERSISKENNNKEIIISKLFLKSFTLVNVRVMNFKHCPVCRNGTTITASER